MGKDCDCKPKKHGKKKVVKCKQQEPKICPNKKCPNKHIKFVCPKKRVCKCGKLICSKTFIEVVDGCKHRKWVI